MRVITCCAAPNQMTKLPDQNREQDCAEHPVSSTRNTPPVTDGHDSVSENPDETIAALREAVRARDDLLAMTAHELRNPLAAIQPEKHS
jgi:signal transduction histidine kinase